MSALFSLTSLILMATAISSDEWFTQNSVKIPNENPNYFNGPKGGLIHSKDFKLFSDTTSDWESLLQECRDEVYGSGLCDELKNFYYLGMIYLAIDACSLAALSICILFFFLHLSPFAVKEKVPLPLVYIINLLCNVLHTIAFIIWSDGVSLSMNSCGDVPYEENNTVSVCASSGALLAISAIPIGFFNNIFFIPLCLQRKANPILENEVAMI